MAWPEGPNNASLTDEIFSLSDSKLYELLTNPTIDVNEIEYSMVGKWAAELTEIMYRLKEQSPRIKTALGDFSKQYIIDSLLEFDHYLRVGDGVSSGPSQTYGSSIVYGYQFNVVSPHLSSIENPNMISDMIRFVQNEEGQLQLGANWDLSTGNSDSNRTCLILVSPREVNAWNTFIAELSTKNGIQGLNSTTIEFPRIGTSPSSSPQNQIISGNFTSGCVVINTSNVFSSYQSNIFEQIGAQIMQSIHSVLSSGFDNVLILAHSLSGKAVLDLIENGDLDDSNCIGLMTVNSPNDGTILENAPKNVLNIVQVLYNLAVNQNVSMTPTEKPQSDGILLADAFSELLEIMMEVLK